MSQTADVDVCIIGAGAAGLAAARTAQASGLSFVVIEARDRIGGRTVTDTSLGAAFDGGATFIHFSDKNPWTQIAVDLGVETQAGSWRGRGYREFRDGVPVSPDEVGSWRAGRGKLWELAEEVDFSNDVSFAELVAKAAPEVVSAGHSMTRGAVGEEPERVSVADYARLYEGGDHIIPTGYGALVARYGADVPVRLGVTATAVDWRGSVVRIATSTGDIRARTVVITVPLGVLKAGRIAFTPSLPNETLRGLDGLAMGALSKIGLKFNGDRLGATPGMFYSELRGARPGVSFEMWPFDRDIVVCWYGADYAREVNKMGQAGACDHMLERLVALIGADARKAYVGGKLFAWSEDPLSFGSYSYARPGHAQARDVLRKPVGERLWFAGEAMAGKMSMTVGGAHQTGEQAIKSIASKLKLR